MKPPSPLAHALGDASPTVGLRDWLAGARPVAGAAAASALLVVACSLFALGAGGLGRHKDVGQPSPVRLRANHTRTTHAPAPRTTHVSHARGTVGRATAPRGHDVVNTVRSGPETPTPASHAGRPDSTPPASRPAQAPSTPTPQPTAPPPSTTNLPAPLDDVPNTVTVPPTPATPAVTVPLPQTPAVPPAPPVVTTVTSTLGLP